MGLFKKKDGLYDYIWKHTVNPTKKGVKRVVKQLRKPGEDWEHLTEDRELPFGWYTRHHYIVQPYEDTIVQMAVELKKYEGIDRMAQLERLIGYYYDFKNFCYSKNECFIKYFQDMWEHCHNSRCEDFEYITHYVEELNEMKNK